MNKIERCFKVLETELSAVNLLRGQKDVSPRCFITIYWTGYFNSVGKVMSLIFRGGNRGGAMKAGEKRARDGPAKAEREKKRKRERPEGGGGWLIYVRQVCV